MVHILSYHLICCIVHIGNNCAGIIEQYHGAFKDKVKVHIQDVLAMQLHKY